MAGAKPASPANATALAARRDAPRLGSPPVCGLFRETVLRARQRSDRHVLRRRQRAAQQRGGRPEDQAPCPYDERSPAGRPSPETEGRDQARQRWARFGMNDHIEGIVE